MAKETRTYRDRAASIIKAVKVRRKKLKDMSVAYKGGKCSICGYSGFSAALDLHHLDPAKKDFGLSVKGLTRSWEKIKEELDKCVLVCANCHREIHGGMIELKEVNGYNNPVR